MEKIEEQALNLSNKFTTAQRVLPSIDEHSGTRVFPQGNCACEVETKSEREAGANYPPIYV